MAQRMTPWGVGPVLALTSLAYFAVAMALHLSNPDLLRMSRDPHIAYTIAGSILVVTGFVIWALGARVIHKAFREGRLLTTGVYGLVRNPMYSAFIVFVSPGVALWFRSWILLTMPVVAYVIFRLLIRKEEVYLQEKFGQAYLDYKRRVNALIPFARLWKRTKSAG